MQMLLLVKQRRGTVVRLRQQINVPTAVIFILLCRLPSPNPSAFRHTHEGVSATLTAPHGLRSRKAYVTVALAFLGRLRRAFVDEAIMIAIRRDDHAALVCGIDLHNLLPGTGSNKST